MTTTLTMECQVDNFNNDQVATVRNMDDGDVEFIDNSGNSMFFTQDQARELAKALVKVANFAKEITKS